MKVRALVTALSLAFFATAVMAAEGSEPSAEATPESATTATPDPAGSTAPTPATLPSKPASVGAPAAADEGPIYGKPTWTPPSAAPEKWEWVELKSGEWLKGELKVMREDKLTFDSDDLDELEIDWSDVAAFYSSRINTFAFTERRVATGLGRVEDDKVFILTAQGEQTYRRAALLSIVTGDLKERNYWSGKGSLGFTARGGNTQQVDALALANVRRRTPFTRLALDYRANFGTVSQVETVNNQKGDARFDLFVYDNFFITPATIEVYADVFQNIDVRVTAGAGIGYEIMDTSRLTWRVGLDGVYRQTRFDSVPTGEPDIQRGGAARLSTSWEAELTSRIDLDGNYEVTLGIPDIEDTNQHALVTLSVEITSIFDLDVSFIWDRVGKPARAADGSIPLKDDVTLSVGIGFDF